MSTTRPSIDEIKSVIANHVFVLCPTLLINVLSDRLDDEWLSMHYNDIESDDDVDEIFEYYLVSSWFGEGMRMIDEPAMELETGVWIWGRTETGLNLEYSSVIGDMIVAWHENVNNILNK